MVIQHHHFHHQPTALVVVKRPNFLYVDWLLGQFADQKKVARSLYRKFVAEGMGGDKEKLWEKLTGQIILGGETFVARVQGMLDEKKEIKEIPRIQRFPGRPSLTKIFTLKTREDKNKRNAAIHAAHSTYGYTLKEIGNCLGLHYSTVSRVVAKSKK